jgi:Neisseria PilC beta-propeller domain
MNTETLLFKPNYYNKLYRTKQRAAIFLAVCVTVLFSPKLQANTSTNPVGSSLGLIGQVVTGKGNSLDSTNAIASGDTVQWTALFESKLSSPYRSTGIMTLPKNFKWLNGSVVLPPKVSLEYSKDGGTNYEMAEPSTGTTITHVRWTINPLFTLEVKPVIPSVVDFTGTGDGYRVIPYKENLYVVNHHTASTYVNCRQAADSLPCPGFQNSGLTIPSALGISAVGYSDESFVTPNRSIEYLDQKTGNLYVYGAINFDIYVRCLNLNTLKACSNQVFMGTNPNATDKAAVNPMDSIGTKYYATMSGVLSGNTLKMFCYDTATQKPCKGQPYNTDWVNQHHNTPGYAYDGKIYTSASRNGKGSQVLQCFDTKSNSPCAGLWKNSKNDMITEMSLFPHLDKKGVWTGLCTIHSGTSNNCLDLLKKPFSSTTSYRTYIANNGFYQENHGEISNGIATDSRIFLSSNDNANYNHATCFDFKTNSECFGAINDANSNKVSTYSIIKDPIRNNCMWSVGHVAKAKSFDLNTGEPCAGKPVYPPITLLDIVPNSYYNCDGSKANVTKWGAVRFSPSLVWGAGGITSAKIIILNKTNNTKVLEKNIPFGKYEVSIAEIVYRDNPELTIQLLLESNKGSSIKKEVGFDVTWEGDPIQLCFKTTAPTLDNCAVEASVVQTNTQIHTPSNSEVLNAKAGLVPGETASGVGPNPTTTTLRQYPKGSSDPTQIMQTYFDLKTFTGGLNQYKLLSDLTVSDKPVYDNQKLGFGSLFTSISGIGKSHIVYSGNFNQLSVEQKAALNKNTKGIVDNKGVERYNKMPNMRIGPVINSSPATLLKRSIVGYSEQQYPGYSAFKNTANRTETMVFYQGNDGLLRAYDVTKLSGLKAKFSFLPGSLFLKGASRYTDATLFDLRKDPFLLDATPLISDVNLSDVKTESKWSTVLVGNQGRGGSLVYALDVTKGNLGNLLFEYTADSDPTLKDLGKVVSPQPNDKVSGADQIVRLNNDRWAYIMGNGINSNKQSKLATGTAALYILYLNAKTSNKAKWLAISVPSDGSMTDPVLFNNGLSTPRPVDINDDGSVDLVYAGDIQGNLWRFDLTDMSRVKVKKIFKTTSGEPIYTAPLVTRLPAADALCKKVGGISDLKKCWMVSFGTGDLIDALGKTTEEMTGVVSNITQSLYGIYDAADDILVDSSKLMQKTINRTGAVDTEAVDYTKQQRGWRLTLPATGERVTANPVLPASGSLALFATGRPLGYSANGVCYPTEGWLTAIDVSTGQQTNSFTSSTDGPVSSIPIGQPLLGNVDINPNASTTNNTSTVFSSGSNSVANKPPSLINLNLPTIQGRISWREVFDLPK